MRDSESFAPIFEGEEHLIAAAQHIAKVLESKKSLSSGARKVLADLGTQLSSITLVEAEEKKGLKINEIEERLDAIQDKVMHWKVQQSMLWDCPDEASEYLKAVDEARKLAESLDSLSLTKDSQEDVLLRRVHDVLQTAMARLEKEFAHILVHNRQPFDPEKLSFRSRGEDIVDEASMVSFGEDPVVDIIQRDSVGRSSEEYLIDLVRPIVVPDLKCIAELMFNCNYGWECSQAFISVWKDALDDCLFILDMEKLSIEDVLRMEWDTLDAKIRRWIWAMKIFVRVYLTSEKWLSDQIFGMLDSVGLVCFAESSKASVLQLLNFGEAIIAGPHKPEKLLRVLEMYEMLADVIPDIDALYADESGSYVKTECQDVLKRLGDCVKATFVEFENAVGSNVSTTPIASGGIHPLISYVMNYIKTLEDYGQTLSILLKDHDREELISMSPDASPVAEADDNREKSSSCSSLVARHFQSLVSILECNLEEKSKLYKDDSLRYLFLMNNIHYMAGKVKGSELKAILGDEWIRKHNGKLRQHAMNYERATWSAILPLLTDEGIYNPGSNTISGTILKERLQSFYLAFEEVYKNQTAWFIPDSQLREELRISASQKVVQAYRPFVGRHINHISDKHIKYSADDIENYILDLFEGSPRSLPSSRRK